MRRLFSTFAEGWPGAGLLILRLVAGTAVLFRAVNGIETSQTTAQVILAIFGIATGALLFAGLWTPISGSLVAIYCLWNVISKTGDLWANILLAAIGAALALIGPGAWSVDARLFGWKRIEIPSREP